MQISIEELYSIYLKHRTVSTDSRLITPGCLFFALKGDSFDGNKYAEIALDAGAAFAVIDDEAYDGSKTLLVNDVLETMQSLALMHRRNFNIPVVAITGSNGKTTTKELINAVLSQQYHVTATKGNLNNHIGVPLTLLEITNDTQIAIIEMGANHQLEIEHLCQLAEPSHGLITNIGRAHLGGFGGFEGVVKAKSELYTWLHQSDGTVFVNSGNPLLMDLTIGMKRILYGSEEGLYTRGIARNNTTNLELEWFSGNAKIIIQTNLVGNYNFENVMAAICIGTIFDVSPDKIQAAINSYQPSNSRSQAMKTARNYIILDAYNANPTSMQLAIENFKLINAPYKMVILGDMLELGEESPEEHRAIVDMVSVSGFDRVILVGPNFKSVATEGFQCFGNSDEAREWLQKEEIKDFTILVKGSRGIKMEKVLEAL